jgi:hypothetical protein
MGRRWKSHIPAEMVEDMGLPGKLYFDRPQVIDITTSRDGGSTKVITQDVRALSGPVRLASTRGLHDFKKIEVVEYHAPLRPSIEEISSYMKWAEISGFGNGAVVARRWCADWRWESPFQWGVILGNRLYPPAMEDSYAPFSVQWFDKNQGTETAWAEDLLLIHQCLSKQLLESLVEEQIE